MAPLTLRLLVSLIAGLAGGVHANPWTSDLAQIVFAMGVMVALLAHANRWPHTRDLAAWTSVACVAWLLGLQAVDQALRPSLLAALEEGSHDRSHDGSDDGADDDSRSAERSGSNGRASGNLRPSSNVRAHPRSNSRPNLLTNPVIAEGLLRQDAALGATGVVLRLAIDRGSMGGAQPRAASGGVSVVVVGELAPKLYGEWTDGRRVRAPMALRRPASYLNDGVPDFERTLALRGVALVGTIKSGAVVEVLAPGAVWEEWGARRRAQVRTALAAHLSPGAGAVAVAILIGDRAALASEIERRLQEAGTYHVLAISGGNIAILAGAVVGALALAGWRGRGAAMVAMLLLGAYAVIVQGGPSVARATSMALLYLAIRLIDQRTAAVNALALVVTGILLVDPLAVTDVGLWLTAGATLGIVLGAERMRAWPWSAGRLVTALLMATVAAEIMLMPVSAFVFQRVTLAGVGLNFIAIPCMTVVQLGAMAIAALDTAGLRAAAAIAAWPTEWAVTGLVDSASFVDYAPWLTWRVPPPSVWTLLMYYASLGGWWLGSRTMIDTRLRRDGVRACGAITVTLFLWIAADPPSLVKSLGDGRLHVTTIDVGQGDCILVTFPNGRRLLVDTGGVTVGGDFDIGDRIVGPALRARGVRRLDYLAITHGDPDHIGGARAVIRDFAPTEVWQGVPVANHAPTKMLRAEAELLGATWRTLQRGDRLDVGGVELHVLHPPPPDWERQRVRNDDSLVFELRIGDVSVLLTGDIGREVEHTLKALTPPLLTPVALRILKVPHHGSATSSSAALIETLSPVVATIGVGRGNPFGHPAPQVLDRYKDAGTEVFRTDEDGQIDVVTDGRQIDVRTFNGRTRTYRQPRRHEDTKE